MLIRFDSKSSLISKGLESKLTAKVKSFDILLCIYFLVLYNSQDGNTDEFIYFKQDGGISILNAKYYMEVPMM